MRTIAAIALAISITPALAEVSAAPASEVAGQLPTLSESDVLLKKALDLSRRERNVEAENMVRKALDTQQLLLPANHPRIGTAFEIAGAVFYNNGDYSEAEAYFRNSLAIFSKAAGPTSFDASLELGNIAAALREQRRYRDAEQLSLNSLKLRRAVVPADSAYLAGGFDNLGRTYLATGRYISAQDMFRQSRDILARHVNSDDPAIRRERDMLALATSKQNELVWGNTIILLSPVLVALLAFLAELPFIKAIPFLKRAIEFVTVGAAVAFKGFAIYFGAFVLMPLLLWVLPTPLDATQIKPVAMLIGGASGLGAITAFEALLKWARKVIAPAMASGFAAKF